MAPPYDVGPVASTSGLNDVQFSFLESWVLHCFSPNCSLLKVNLEWFPNKMLVGPGVLLSFLF
jgi:hypothetical protein